VSVEQQITHWAEKFNFSEKLNFSASSGRTFEGPTHFQSRKTLRAQRLCGEILTLPPELKYTQREEGPSLFARGNALEWGFQGYV